MKKMPKNANNFYCKICDFECSKKSNYDKHILTQKHKNRTFRTEKMPKTVITRFTCECGKTYKARNSLWYHKKKCNFIDISNNNENNNDNIVNIDNSSNEMDSYKELLLKSMKKNEELQYLIIEQKEEHNKQLMEILPNIGNNNNNTNNLNIFLNETCKDAINIKEFINSLKLQISDLETTAKLGYVDGISKVFINGLQQLDITKRPIHSGNEDIVYIKDANSWEEDSKHEKTKEAIYQIEKKNTQLITSWIDKHPDCLDSSNNNNIMYNNIVKNIIPEKKDNIDKNTSKIVKNIMKEVFIDKN